MVFANNFKCSKAGNPIAKGPHNNAPTRPRNLSNLSAKKSPSIVAETTTRVRERFYIQYYAFEFLLKHLQNKVSRAVLVG